MQVHASWPLLLPYAAGAWLSRWRSSARALAADAAGLVFGALLTGSLLLPTLLVYGMGAGSGGTGGSQPGAAGGAGQDASGGAAGAAGEGGTAPGGQGGAVIGGGHGGDG